MKKRIKLTESQLNKVLVHSVKNILKEYEYERGPIDPENEDELPYGIINGQKFYSEEEGEKLNAIFDAIVTLKNAKEKVSAAVDETQDDFKTSSRLSRYIDSLERIIDELESEYGQVD